MSDSSNSSLSSKISTTSEAKNKGERGRESSPPGARLRAAFTNLFRSKSATIGFVIILIWILIAISAPLISPYSPTELAGTKLESPSQEHWLGTDLIGRDVLTRLFWGTRVVVTLAPVSVLLGLMIGAPLGLISGYSGGTIDTLIMRGTDILLRRLTSSFLWQSGMSPPLPELCAASRWTNAPRIMSAQPGCAENGCPIFCCGKSFLMYPGRSSSMPPSGSGMRSWPSALWASSDWVYRHRRQTGEA